MTSSSAPPQSAQQQPRKQPTKVGTVAVKAASTIVRRNSRAASIHGGAKTETKAVAAADRQPRRSKCRVTVDVSACRYAIIRKCLRDCDFRLVKKSASDSTAALLPAKWDIWWSDRGDLLQHLPRLSPFQKINHFPSMEEICRKDFLASNLNAICKVLPEAFDFFPRSFLIPAENIDLRSAMEGGPKNATYIVKPRTLCQGRGISLIQSFSKLPTSESCVVQRYIDNPMLVDGLKFDLRVYVLVYSVNPLKIYIFRNGLARFCTTPFQKPTAKNLTKKRMHLTNYAINKKSKNFQQAAVVDGDNRASKRSLASIMKYLDDSTPFASVNVWDQICDIVVKTLMCIEPKLQSSYKSYFGGSNDAAESQWGPKCFEVLGFDIMLDAAGKAWLLEVNHAPSFAGDSPLDREVKTALISSTLKIIGVTNEKKREYIRQQRDTWTKRLWTTNHASTKQSRHRDTHDDVQDSNKAGPDDPQVVVDDDPESNASASGSEDSDDTERLGRPSDSSDSPGAKQRTGKVNLKNILLRRNRVAPTCGAPHDTSEFGNEFFLYPVDESAIALKCGINVSYAAKVRQYERVREAAQVNKSKLWN